MKSSTELTRPAISVVIPNYNGAELLAANLPGLFEALAFSGADHEVIISDDASTDGSVAFLKVPRVKTRGVLCSLRPC